MDRIRIYIDRINKNEFHSSDMPLLLKALRQDAKNGFIELKRDDIQMFNIYSFALQQLELLSGNAPSTAHTGDWRETVDDLSMLRQVIDKMEESGLITNVSWNAGGLAIFDIPGTRLYREYVYQMMRRHLAKLYEISV